MYANYFDSNYFRKSVGIKNTFHHSHKKRKDSLETRFVCAETG